MRPNVDNVIVSYGDMSQSEVLGLGKVVVAPDISIVDVILLRLLAIIYFQFLHLERWALPSSLIMILWYSCGSSL
jgi:hypothetical protein